MAEAKKKASKKVTTKKKVAIKKKVSVGEKEPSKKGASASNREKVAESRKALVAKLREDLKATKETFKLVKTAVVNEAAVVRERLSGVLEGRDELLDSGEQKVKQVVAAGDQWGKQQQAKIKNAAETIRRRIGK